MGMQERTWGDVEASVRPWNGREPPGKGTKVIAGLPVWDSGKRLRLQMDIWVSSQVQNQEAGRWRGVTQPDQVVRAGVRPRTSRIQGGLNVWRN